MKLTIREALNRASLLLSRAGVSSPRLDAEVILSFLLGEERAYLYAHSDEALVDKEEKFFMLVEERASGKPVAYITGEKEFFGRRFAVNEHVLIPRAETEILVEVALKLVQSLPAPAQILDLGSGSGAIVISLLLEIPGARAAAVDISPAALAVASRNRAFYHLEERLKLYSGDLWQAVPAGSKFNLVVSNPPYIPEAEFPQLPREVRAEPRTALLAGEGGLEYYRRILSGVSAFMEEDSTLVLEVGYGQADQVVTLCRQCRLFKSVGTAFDLAGIERVVWAATKPDHAINHF